MGEKSKAEQWFEIHFLPCVGTWGPMYEAVRAHLDDLDELGPKESADDIYRRFFATVGTSEHRAVVRERLQRFKEMFMAASADKEEG